MKSDLYIKSVLTIIAACLLVIVIRGNPTTRRLKNGQRVLAVTVADNELDVNVTNPELHVNVTNPDLRVKANDPLEVVVANRAVPISGSVTIEGTVNVRGNVTQGSIARCPECSGSGRVRPLFSNNEIQCARCRGTGKVTVE
jgi:hypothetical protein